MAGVDSGPLRNPRLGDGFFVSGAESDCGIVDNLRVHGEARKGGFHSLSHQRADHLPPDGLGCRNLRAKGKTACAPAEGGHHAQAGGATELQGSAARA